MKCKGLTYTYLVLFSFCSDLKKNYLNLFFTAENPPAEVTNVHKLLQVWSNLFPFYER